MNIPEITLSEDTAIDVVTAVVNKAHEKMGIRLNLFEFAQSRNVVGTKAILSLSGLKRPFGINGEKFIREAIEKTWRLTRTLHYVLKYLPGSQNEISRFYYFEAIFSQPTAAFPIPQCTVSVFFRIEDSNVEPSHVTVIPKMIFRVEGHYTDHDVRTTKLTIDMILAMISMKIRMFDRIEFIRIF